MASSQTAPKKDTKATAESKAEQQPAAAEQKPAALEEDDEFEDFPVDGASSSLQSTERPFELTHMPQ